MFRPGNLGHLGRLGLVAASRNAFTPLSLFAAGEQGAWYDPSDLSTLFQDSAGTTPVTAAGQPVGRMLDKSGRGNHATQSTYGNRPALQIDASGKYNLQSTSSTWLSTSAIDLTATDKICIFTGLLKSSDVAGIVSEFSLNSNTNAGSFYLSAGTELVNGYHAISRGTSPPSNHQVARVSVFSAPDLAVLSVTHNISGDLSTIRRNGVSGASGTGDKGAGNFGNYPLFLFRRAGSSIPFVGNFYGLIVRGAMSNAEQIANTERWMAAKTGVIM